MIGVAFGKKILEHFVEHQPAGPIVPLALLILDDAALIIENLLADRPEQMPHAVALHEQSEVDRSGRHGLEIVGAIERSGAVIVGRPDLLQVGEIVAGKIFRPVEHQMLEQVGKAGLAHRLVLGADVVPHADPDHGRLAVLMDDHRQSIGEAKGLMRDRHLVDQSGDRHRRARHRRRCVRHRRGATVAHRIRCGGRAGREQRGSSKQNRQAQRFRHWRSPMKVGAILIAKRHRASRIDQCPRLIDQRRR